MSLTNSNHPVQNTFFVVTRFIDFGFTQVSLFHNLFDSQLGHIYVHSLVSDFEKVAKFEEFDFAHAFTKPDGFSFL